MGNTLQENSENNIIKTTFDFYSSQLGYEGTIEIYVIQNQQWYDLLRYLE